MITLKIERLAIGAYPRLQWQLHLACLGQLKELLDLEAAVLGL